MELYSTKRESPNVGFEEAIFRGLPSDNGLFMPCEIPVLPNSFWANLSNLSLQEIAIEVTYALLAADFDKNTIKEIINSAIDFDAPLTKLDENLYCLELFHGPSMAFKDFGARFMAATMANYLKKSNKKINILVATSGDTGGAVAQGFFKRENISVTILYPKGKVSEIQEKQLTTLGHNVNATEIKGTFDDCQALVKQAFLDNDLKSKFNLASANSINISRLIPQMFYYVNAYARLAKFGKKLIFSVPSGNFGNLTAGLLAQKMGMPVKFFVAATNVNKVVPNYLETGIYEAISPSISTISNAMDVGNPSNFPRMQEMFGNDLESMKANVKGCWFTDDETKQAVAEIKAKYNYLACPHTAIAYLGIKPFLNDSNIGVFLSTAHYAKFLPEMEAILGYTPEIPTRLAELLELEKKSIVLENDYKLFKNHLESILI